MFTRSRHVTSAPSTTKTTRVQLATSPAGRVVMSRKLAVVSKIALDMQSIANASAATKNVQVASSSTTQDASSSTIRQPPTASKLDPDSNDGADARPFQCPVCYFATKRNHILEAHMRIHRGGRFKCDVCEFSADEVQKLKRHKQNHNRQQSLACGLCPYIGKTLYMARRHMRTHSVDRPFACSLCAYKCKQPCELRRHRRRVHGGDGNADDHDDDEWNEQAANTRGRHGHAIDISLVCAECGHRATSADMHAEHARTHGARVFKCTQCPFASATRANLGAHMTTAHAGERPFACNVCEFATRRRVHLVVHMRTHASSCTTTSTTDPGENSDEVEVEDGVDDAGERMTCDEENLCMNAIKIEQDID